MKQLRILFALILLIVAGTNYAEERIIVPTVNVVPGSRAIVVVKCEFTSENITLYQLDLYLPDGITLPKNDNGRFAAGTTYLLSDRHDEHTVTIKDRNGFYRIVVSNNNGNTIAPGSGELLRFNVDVAESVNSTQKAYIKQFSMFETDETEHAMSNVDFDLIVPTQNITATGISLDKSSLTFTAANQTATLIATVTPDNATDKSVTWSSNNTAVATIDANGKVTAVSNGTAVITAKTNDGTNLTASCIVTVGVITVTADEKSMIYGDNVPELTYKVNGGMLTGTPKLSTTATKTTDVGSYTIKVEAGSVTNSNVNYVNGTLTIVQAPLTVTANSFTITQGDAMPVFTASYSGFRNGNTESVLTKKPKFSCSATSSSAPGTYDIIVSDAEAKNYSMNYVKGTLTIIKKETTPPVEIADWPHDVIAENLPAGDYTDNALDNWDYVLYTSSAKASDALPIVNGLLTTGNGTAYAIDPSKKNSLVLKATNTPRTLNFTTPAKCEEIRLIAISAEGAASVEAVVNYVDGTNAPVYQFSVDDWYNTESGHGEAVYGFDRINRNSNEFGLIPYFRIFEFTISTDADKIVKGITFKNTSSAIPTILGIAKKGYDAPVEMCTVTYAVRYEGKVVATATEKVAKGNTLPVAPASLTNDFVTLTKSGTHPTTVTKDVTVYFTATWNGPFEFSKTLNDAKWYNLHIRSGYYVSKTDSEPYYPAMADEMERLEPAYLWAFGGDPYHVKVYNYTTGFAETLTKVGENAVVRKGDYTWDLLPNNGGFVLRVTETESTCINQLGGANGPLQFWTNSNSLTDDGSTFRVEEVSMETITVTADDKTMAYGDNVPTLTYKVNGGTLTGTPKLSTTATRTTDVGSYTIKVEAGSVAYSNLELINGTLTITQAPLTVTANSFTITQGDAMPVFTASYSGFRNGNTESVLTKQPKFTCTATSSSTPGTYDIIVSGAEAKNYAMNYVKGTLTIEEKDVSAEISNWYNDVIAEGTPVANYTDETVDNSANCFYSPKVRESGALPITSGKLTTSSGTVYSINPARKNALVLKTSNTPKTLSFTMLDNCEEISFIVISSQGTSTLKAEIQYEDGSTGTAQQLTISDWYSPQSGQGEVIYGLGRINKNDDSFYKDNYFRLFEYTLRADKSKKATGITFTSMNTAIPTILGVVKRITVTADEKSMIYGDNVPELTYKVNGGMLTGTPKLSTTATKTTDVGSYTIKVEAGSVTNSNVNYVNGTLTIVQAPLTVTANSFTITQGDAMPVFTASYSGFRNGNTESVLTKKPKFSCSATSSSAPGTYDIIVSDAEAKNYSMNYVKGTLTIIKKETTPPVEIADWPHDVIAENLPAGDYTDNALDNWDYVLYTSSAKASDALPIVNGLLTTGNGTAYAIDPSKKNSLVLKATNTPRTLNFTTPAKCEEIRLIAISAEGAASVEAVVNYVDGTNAPVYQFSVDDWYNTESGHGEAVYGFDRINRNSNEFGLIPYFRIFEFTISTDADKIVKGITFKNTSSAIPTILGIAKKGYDAPVEMCTVTYAVRYEGKVVATATEKVAKGNTLPVAPASLTNDFVTLTKSGTHPTTVTKDVTVYFTATWNGPFEFSKTLNDAKWYNLHIRSGYYVSKTDSEPYYPAMADEMERLEPAYLWAFGGDPYHVKVYNYTTGFAETLTKVGENAVVRKGDYTWDLLPNNGGFVLRVTETESTCINQLGGANGPLQFWTNSNSLTDDGSTFRVEDVTPLIDGIEFMGESDTSAPIYDLSGRRVSAPIKKGIFIINRKKVLVE